MKFLTAFLFVIFGSSMWAQTFNKRFDFSSPNSLFAGVVAGENTYYVLGTKIGETQPFFPEDILVEFNEIGEIVNLTTGEDSLAQRYGSLPNMVLQDTSIVYSGIKDSAEGRKVYLKKVKKTGETIWEVEYDSYYIDAGETFIISMDLLQDTEGNFYVLNNARHPSTFGNIIVVKLDASGNMIWENSYGISSNFDVSGSITLLSDGNILMATTRLDESYSLDEFEFQTLFTKIDTAGNILWTHITPLEQGQIGRVGGVVEADDGGIIINALYGYEGANGPTRYMKWEKYIYKISSEGELVWELEIPASWLSGSTAAWRMIRVADNSGYVAVARDLLYDGGEDSISQRGWIGKVDDNGNLLWGRSYVGVDSDNDFQMLYDVKEAADGGFVAVGWSEDDNADTLARQAWIIKTDEYGCIVPGCNLTSTEDPEATQISLSLYPNPSSDILNVWYASADFNPRQPPRFQVTDMQGRVWRSFSADTNNVTLMLSVRDLPVGSYLLTCSERREALPFVVVR